MKKHTTPAADALTEAEPRGRKGAGETAVLAIVLLGALLAALAAAAGCSSDDVDTARQSAEVQYVSPYYREMFDMLFPSYTEGDYEYDLFGDGGACLMEYTGSDSDLHLPETLGGERLLTIGDSAFKENQTLESVSIPDGCEYIGDRAFAMCPSLRCVEMPDSVTHIGTAAFGRCPRIDELRLPAELLVIGEAAFSECSVSSIELPDKLQIIERDAFGSCPALEYVKIPESTVVLREGAFRGCDALKEIALPASLHMDSGAPLAGCSALETITLYGDGKALCLKDGVLFSGDGKTLIKYPSARGGDYAVPKGTKIISRRAFSECGQLESVTVPKCVKTIEPDAFFECPRLKNVTIPSSVKELDEGAFDKAVDSGVI